MIYGVVAAEFHGVLPPAITALGSFDFVNGAYDWNGTTLAASDVTDQTGWIGADGLSVPGSGDYGAQIIYAAAQTLLATCAFTMAIEVETLNDYEADPLVVCNTGEYYYINIQVYGQSMWGAYDACPTNTSRAAEDFNGVVLGVHKVAISRNDAAISISVDGNAVVTNTEANSVLPVEGYPMTKFYFGGWPDYTVGAIKIRSAAFYDLQSDADLPSLSA